VVEGLAFGGNCIAFIIVSMYQKHAVMEIEASGSSDTIYSCNTIYMHDSSLTVSAATARNSVYVERYESKRLEIYSVRSITVSMCIARMRLTHCRIPQLYHWTVHQRLQLTFVLSFFYL